jgi:cellulose biosynthesis protein BcsQ
MATQLLPPGTGEVWAVLSRKGGPGKTTVTHALASGFALRGFRVLVLEVEDNPRLWHLLTGGSTRYNQPPDDSQTVFGLFREPEGGLGGAAYPIDVAAQFQRLPYLGKDAVQQLSVQRGWTQPQPMDFVPGSESLRDMEGMLAQEAAGGRGRTSIPPFLRLSAAIDSIRPHYDLIVMDTPPTLNIVQHNATLAAQRLVVVLDFDADSIEDYGRTTSFVADVQTSALGLRVKPPEILGVVYNKYDATFQENDVRLLFAYTNPHEDPRTKARRGPLVSHAQLGILPYDRRALVGSMNERVSMHTYKPTSELGRAMYDLCGRLEQQTGMGRYARVAPAGVTVRG